MEYIKETQILLYETLCAESADEGSIKTKALRRFKDNIRLVHSIAYKFGIPWNAYFDRDDVVQEGYLGLWKACLGFDEDKGYEFSTYAVPVIRGQILRMYRDSDVLKTPRWFKDIRSALKSHGFSLPLNDQEIDVLVSEGKFSRAQIMSYAEPEVVSIDGNMMGKHGEEGRPIADSIPDPTSYFDRELSEDEIEAAIDIIVGYLKPNHRDLVEEWMYSVLAGDKITQQQLATKYNIGQPHVGRILRAAIQAAQMNQEEIRSIFGY